MNAIEELTDELGAHSVVKAVDTREAMMQAIDAALPLDQAAEGYRAMEQRDAIKVLLRP